MADRPARLHAAAICSLLRPVIGFTVRQPMYPELAFYDCHAAITRWTDRRWNRRVAGPGIPPGSLRLQTDHLLVLQATADALDPVARTRLSKPTNGFVRAGQRSVAAVADSSANVAEMGRQRTIAPGSRRSSPRQKSAMSGAALHVTRPSGRMGDFAAAEQTFLGVESLSLYSRRRQRTRAARSTRCSSPSKNDTAIQSPTQFAAAAKPICAARAVIARQLRRADTRGQAARATTKTRSASTRRAGCGWSRTAWADTRAARWRAPS